jgi:hypothetical protein
VVCMVGAPVVGYTNGMLSSSLDGHWKDKPPTGGYGPISVDPTAPTWPVA